MAVFQAPQSSLPVDTFEGLLPALTNILKVVYDAGDSEESKHKLAITAATDELKEKLARAKELVENLPGGEMLLEDQDEAIAALERLRDQRRRVLYTHVEQFRANGYHLCLIRAHILTFADSKSLSQVAKPVVEQAEPTMQQNPDVPMDSGDS
ncbi:hypothetical protein FRB94_003934 [Tulasnella sp. JGI-2019a]|nr:hypothetical protein FRB94_003934 [Tulasnella sp. JGI-2019a]